MAAAVAAAAAVGDWYPRRFCVQLMMTLLLLCFRLSLCGHQHLILSWVDLRSNDITLSEIDCNFVACRYMFMLFLHQIVVQFAARSSIYSNVEKLCVATHALDRSFLYRRIFKDVMFREIISIDASRNT